MHWMVKGFRIEDARLAAYLEALTQASRVEGATQQFVRTEAMRLKDPTQSTEAEVRAWLSAQSGVTVNG